MNSKIDFVKEKTSAGLIKMAVPLLIAMILNMAYNIVDSLWIGNLLGEEAMAALTSATPIVLILTSIGMGATNGLTILLSQAIGAKDKKGVRKLLSTSFISSIIFCIGITILCEISLNGFLSFLQTPDAIFSMVKSYLKIYFVGFLAVYFYLYFTAVLRSYGNSMFQVAGILFCTILNGVLDPFFIKYMGIEGAAIATVLSQTIAVVLMTIYVIKKKLIYVNLKDFDKENLLDLIKKALPSVVQQSIPALSTTVLTSIVSGFGVTAIAAYGITGKLETILFYPAMALNMAITAIIGQCYGAGRFDRVKDYLKLSLIYGGGLLLVLSALVIVYSNGLSHLFLDSMNVAEIVHSYFMIVSIGYILNTVTNCYLGTINGFGRPMMGMFIMIFYYIIVRMPLAYILSKSTLLLNGIWWAVLISHIVASISSILIFKVIVNKPGKKESRNVKGNTAFN